MTECVVVHGFSEHHTRQEVIDHWQRRWRELQHLLRPFSPGQRSPRLMVNYEAAQCEARIVLLLPTATLTGTGRSQSDPMAAIDQAADRLAGEIRHHKSVLRRQFLYHRRHRRRGDLAGIASALQLYHAAGDRGAFADLLRPALRELSDHARRELVVAQLEGVVRPGELTVSRLMGELVTRAWRHFDDRPARQRLELWLTGLLHQLLDERGDEPHAASETDAHADDPRYSAGNGWDEAAEPFWPPMEKLTFADVVPTGSSPSALDLATDEEQRVWILSQLRGFGREQRRAFTLYTLEGWTADEVASLQRRTPEAVLLDVDRVRDELASKLEESVATPSS